MAAWPSYFPVECPPADARKDDVWVYRLVSNLPPSLNDFLPAKIEQPERQFKPNEICAACGVSVFRDVQDLIKKRSRYKPLRAKRIVFGQISKLDGLVLETFDHSHMTWWLQTATPHANFTEYFENGTA